MNAVGEQAQNASVTTDPFADLRKEIKDSTAHVIDRVGQSAHEALPGCMDTVPLSCSAATVPIQAFVTVKAPYVAPFVNPAIASCATTLGRESAACMQPKIAASIDDSVETTKTCSLQSIDQSFDCMPNSLG